MKERTANHSNYSWHLDTASLDLVIQRESNALKERPVLTVARDVYSQRVVGYHLGFEQPTAATIAALLFAIHPKINPPE